MNNNADGLPADAAGLDGKSPWQGCAKHLWPLIIALGAIGLCVWMISLDNERGQNEINYVYHFSYFGFAMVGVVFHLASKYRELRDSQGFDLAKYWLDYLFRLFQACLYVFIIDNLLNGAAPQPGVPATGGQPSEAAKGLSFSMTLMALFTGLYIRKVEAAIENLGERFGETLKGILGASLEQATAEEQKQAAGALRTELDRLKEAYLGLGEVDSAQAGGIEGQLRSALELLHKGRLEAAEKVLLDVEFGLKALRKP